MTECTEQFCPVSDEDLAYIFEDEEYVANKVFTYGYSLEWVDNNQDLEGNGDDGVS